MLSATMKYGAMRAKVMAMYGKMLNQNDFAQLLECKTMGDISSFFRNHHGWDESCAGLPGVATAENLKKMVIERMYSDQERLFKSSFSDDRKYLRFLIDRAEYGIILSQLRGLCSGEFSDAREYPEFISKHASFDVQALFNCRDYPELLKTIEESLYHKPLSKLPINGETGLPSFGAAAIVLENTYYMEVFSFVEKKFKGFGKELLAEFLGAEADLLNVISILRLHRCFPESLPDSKLLLIPVTGRLKPALVTALENAGDEQEAKEIIRKSPLGRRFSDFDTDNLEAAYIQAMIRFCRRLIKAPEPSICDAQAFLCLRELECKKIVRIIEAVDCGVDPKLAL